MTGREDDFARKITAYLDQGASELKPGTAYRLQLARAEALARLSEAVPAPQPQLAHALVGPGSGSQGGRRNFWTSGRLWLGIALIAAAGFGIQQWQAYQQLKELAETDSALLSSDLPIDAYLDRGFQNWLKTSTDD